MVKYSLLGRDVSYCLGLLSWVSVNPEDRNACLVDSGGCVG